MCAPKRYAKQLSCLSLMLCNCLSIKGICGQGYYHDITLTLSLTTGLYHDITLWSGQYMKYILVVSFDLSCQSGIFFNILVCLVFFVIAYGQYVCDCSIRVTVVLEYLHLLGVVISYFHCASIINIARLMITGCVIMIKYK